MRGGGVSEDYGARFAPAEAGLPQSAPQPGPEPDVKADAVTESTEKVADFLTREELPRLARLAFLLCGDETRADDAAAEALARVWRRARSSEIEQIRPYLRRTLVNVLATNRRRFWSEQRALARLTDGGEGERIDEAVANRTDVRRALQSLPLDQRAVIVLRYFEQLSEEEIATTLHVRAGTVKSRASRGLAALRADLRMGQGGDHV
jgi:RNA polymerase sigma factor (sigma-70 family)